MHLLPKLLRAIIRRGSLRLRGPGGYDATFGDGAGPAVTVRITDPSLDWKIPLNPELAVSEAFMDGRLIVEEGVEGGTAHDLIEVTFLNRDHLQASPAQRVLGALRRASRRLTQYNPQARSRRNVAHHYDLGNSFYRMWLDWDMQYSCGYWPDGVETLDEAQTAKKRHIAAKLRLEPGQRVLDIGCGWGGMALYLAAVAGVEVHGITLSEEQITVARARAREAGLADRVRFSVLDYRELRERYDRIVSVGMLEHVGVGHLDHYFRQVRDCLEADGVALIHSISAIDPPAATGPFTRKYIFPGGYVPRLSEVSAAFERAELWCSDVEVWRVHYARTLRAWRERFEARRAEVEAMYDARFARMWEFYLSGAEIGFSLAMNDVLQLQLTRERDVVPLARDYIGPAAAALKAREPDALARLRTATAAAFGEVVPARQAAE